MTSQLFAPFVSYAADVLGDTNLGFSGPQIVKLTGAYALEWDVAMPNDSYPFPQGVPNKRTALFQNLMAFAEGQRYRVIRDLCDNQAVRETNGPAVAKLKSMLVTRYGHLAGETVGSEVDPALIERTQHWLGPFPDALHLYDEATQKHANGVFLRNVLDDLRLALEILLKAVLGNQKSLENQLPLLGDFIKQRQGSPELGNMFRTLLDYFTKYQNTYVKHDDAVIDEEVEFVFELASAFMKHVVRLSYREVE